MSAAPVLGPIGELRAHALAYASYGLDVFPVNPSDKTPLHSQHDATTNPDTIEQWWARWPRALIGHRVAVDQVVTDIDPRHGGLDTWRALKAEIGSLPVTRVHASGRGDGGGHLWWQRPEGRLTTTKLDAWAREHGVGHQLEQRWTSGIDLLQWNHRYTILPPSPHPDTHRPYVWQDGRGLDIEPAAMPALLAELIAAPPAAPVIDTPRERDGDSIADWYGEHAAWRDILTGWTLVSGDGEHDGSRWRHPTATSAFSATIRHGNLFVYSTATAFEPTNPDDPHGYTKYRAYSVLHHHGDMSAAGRHLRQQRGPSVDGDDLAWIKTTSSGSAIVDAPGRHLPDEFWTARPRLEHIRQAARSRYLSPDAVLGAVLARVAACCSHTLELPPTVGIACGLTYYTALTGPPEAGKSTGVGLAAELLPAPANILDRLPIGSGEGMVDVLFEMVTEADPETGKPVKVKRQTKHAAIFYIDEGAVLTDLGARKGSTILPTLRTAWTHGTLGNTNASIETRRVIDGRSYVYGVVLGIQPEKAAQLLADANAGTPQRFVWLSATDPEAPDHTPEWPGPLDWRPYTQAELIDWQTSRGGWVRHVMHLDPAISATIRADRLAVLRETEQRAELDAHRLLGRVKTAALLAQLDDRMDVTEDDWHLAGMVTDTSRNVRNTVVNTISSAERQRIEAEAERHSQREMHVDRKRAEIARASAARSVAKVVRKHTAGDAHGDEGCTRRCLTNAIAGKYREFVTLDDLVAEAESSKWIEGADGRWKPGPEQP